MNISWVEFTLDPTYHQNTDWILPPSSSYIFLPTSQEKFKLLVMGSLFHVLDDLVCASSPASTVLSVLPMASGWSCGTTCHGLCRPKASGLLVLLRTPLANSYSFFVNPLNCHHLKWPTSIPYSLVAVPSSELHHTLHLLIIHYIIIVLWPDYLSHRHKNLPVGA